MIAIDPSNRLFYEGSSNYGHGIWPSPVVSIATFIRADADRNAIPQGGEIRSAKMVFREDSFDAVTRIRRGRFYVGAANQPDTWYVQTHPAYANETGHRDHQGRLIKSLCGFVAWGIEEDFRQNPIKVIVALGVADAYTLWKIVGIERVATGEFLVTLRAKASLGALPEPFIDKIPNLGRDQVLLKLDKVVEAAQQSGPESVVDRCRDAAAAMLGLWMSHEFGDPELRKLDIGKLVEKLQRENGKVRAIIVSSATAIARLHARAKPNEEIRFDSRTLVEGDAECSVALVGMLMRELGWAMDSH